MTRYCEGIGCQWCLNLHIKFANNLYCILKGITFPSLIDYVTKIRLLNFQFLYLRIVEMNDWSIVLYHINFFNSRNIVDLKIVNHISWLLKSKNFYSKLYLWLPYLNKRQNILTESFFNDDCNFLSSVVAVRWTTFFFRRCVPFPPTRTWAWSFANFSAFIFMCVYVY